MRIRLKNLNRKCNWRRGCQR